MNIYSEATSEAAQTALKRLGEQLHTPELLYGAAVQDRKSRPPTPGDGF
ncbi:hypothetical protein [Micromonospora rhizosphaerae]|nr:hypothetical protein [Micromonospora rhizosphaerae]